MDTQKIINDIISKEKGYANNPSDRGGPTNFGITLAVAVANGYRGDMKDFPLSMAEIIYTNRYINGPRFNLVEAQSEVIAEKLIDIGVNMGPATASVFFQRWLNAFNAQGSRYADMFVDGKIGVVTLSCLKAFLAWRGVEGEGVFVKALAHIQGYRYLDIAERDKTQEDFIYGWIKNRT